MEKVQIVIAWLVEEVRFSGKPYAADLGERPKMETVRDARACMWLNAGTEVDVEKARKYAASDVSRSSTDPDATRHVFVFQKTEKDPIGRAKREVLKAKVAA